MRKCLCFILALVLLLSTCSGCKKADKQVSAFMADNEILTYEKIDVSKTTLLVSMLGNNEKVKRFAEAFEAKNPDVQVICLDITGGDAQYKPLDDWLQHGMTPDLMFSNSRLMQDERNGMDFLTDLSAHSAVSRFEVDSLDRLAQDGHIYYLPGPSEVNCMICNKKLFEQYGWQFPKTFDEFVALCLQIREDTNGTVQPWNPNAKYDNVFSTALEGFTYGELFAGMKNAAWYSDFCAGGASYAEHMAPMYTVLQKLVDNELLVEEHFSYSATTRGNEFREGKIAILNHDASAFYEPSENFEAAYYPYPSTDGKTGFLSTSYSLVLCEPKKEHTAQQQDAIDRLITFFASVEGQEAIIGDGLFISNVKDYPISTNSALATVEEAITEGNQFDYFYLGEGKRSCSLTTDALLMVSEGKTGAELMAAVDAAPPVEASAPTREVVAQVAGQGLSILEFSSYIADMYRQTADADIGLIDHGVAYRGNLVRLFPGEIYDTYIHVLKPRSFENGSTLIKVSMTGQQLTDALNHPGTNEEGKNSIYAFSGLKCKVAPWNEPGTKVLEVRLADGSELVPDKLYTVAVWAGTVADEYITQVLETYEGTWEELMTAKMLADKTIIPANDGRLTLVWE